MKKLKFVIVFLASIILLSGFSTGFPYKSLKQFLAGDYNWTGVNTYSGKFIYNPAYAHVTHDDTTFTAVVGDAAPVAVSYNAILVDGSDQWLLEDTSLVYIGTDCLLVDLTGSAHSAFSAANSIIHLLYYLNSAAVPFREGAGGRTIANVLDQGSISFETSLRITTGDTIRVRTESNKSGDYLSEHFDWKVREVKRWLK